MTRLTDDALDELARLAGEAGIHKLEAQGAGIRVDDGDQWWQIGRDARAAAYIAAANPATVAALVAEVRALRAEIAFWIERDNDPAL